MTSQPTQFRFRARVCLALSLLPAILLCGCEPRQDPLPTPPAAMRSEVERGPVKFTVEISPKNPRLSDELQLRLSIQAATGVRIEKPPFGESLGEFLIRDFHEPELVGATEITEQVYVLEPTRAGKLVVAPIAVRFYDERPTGDGRQHTLESEALTLEVSTMLEEDAPALADLKPPAGPVALPAAGGWAGLVTVGVLVVLTAAAVLWKRRRRRAVSPPQLSPQELAWLELEQIVQQKLAESDPKTFYVELTGVVRRYIERTTGVHAAEQTTAEFLHQIVAEGVFEPSDQQRLKDFLESADMVKFAAREPDASDIETSFERAQQFIRLKHTTEVAA